MVVVVVLVVVDGFQNGSLILLKIFSDEVNRKQICPILENLLKTFYIRNNPTSSFKFGDIFPEKKSQISLRKKIIHCISPKTFKNNYQVAGILYNHERRTSKPQTTTAPLI